jgi:hypothetical protein
MNSKFLNIFMAIAFMLFSMDSAFAAKEIEIDIEKKSGKQTLQKKEIKKKSEHKSASKPESKLEEKLVFGEEEDPFDDEFERAPEVDDRFESFNRFMFGVN